VQLSHPTDNVGWVDRDAKQRIVAMRQILDRRLPTAIPRHFRPPMLCRGPPRRVGEHLQSLLWPEGVFKQVAAKGGIIKRANSSLNRESVERKRSSLAFLLLFECDERGTRWRGWRHKCCCTADERCRLYQQNSPRRAAGNAVFNSVTDFRLARGRVAPVQPGPPGAGGKAAGLADTRPVLEQV